jgi:hypothetical protein
MGDDATDEENTDFGTAFLTITYFIIVGITLVHGIHIVNLLTQRKDKWLGYHNLYANFM